MHELIDVMKEGKERMIWRGDLEGEDDLEPFLFWNTMKGIPSVSYIIVPVL